jgi:NAD(P)-dependent dehydrogenase (short-subunit alcohol dehydrogenase family)
MSAGQGRLAGKVAMVTGAAAGIGRATAVRFAAEGAQLVVNDVDAAGLDRLAEQVNGEFGAEVTRVAGDVSQEADAQAIVDAAVAAYGGLDVLVANAGIIPLTGGACS